MSLHDGWIVKIQNQPTSILQEIWVYRHTTDGKAQVLQPDLQTIETVDPYVEDKKQKPTILIHPDILEALVASAKNLVPTPKQFVEGKLEATESHLSDLRQLLKLK